MATPFDVLRDEINRVAEDEEKKMLIALVDIADHWTAQLDKLVAALSPPLPLHPEGAAGGDKPPTGPGGKPVPNFKAV